MVVRWIKQFILIFILIFLTITLNNKKVVYSEYEVDYLKHHVSNVDFKNQQTFHLINEDLLTHQAFISSEIHGIKANNELELNLFKYLNQQANVHFLLLEISFSSGYLLNEYLKTGDEPLLDQVFSFYKGSTFYTKEEYQFFKELYLYNQTLPVDKKITVVGIDLEHSSESFNYLLKSNYDLTIDMYHYLFKNLNDYKQVVDKERFNWQLREELMFENYLLLKEIYQIDKFYGQFGMIHCFKQVINVNYRSFAYFLNHDQRSNMKEKTLVLMTLYENSQYLYTINGINQYKVSKINKNYQNSGIDYFDQKQMMLFKLNEKHSPYYSKQIWMFNDYKVYDPNLKTTQYFDYIILVKESDAATPLTPSRISLEVVMDFLKKKLNQ